MKLQSLNKLFAIICSLVWLLTACDQQQTDQPLPAPVQSFSTTKLIRAGEFNQFELDPQRVNDLQNTALLYDLFEGLVSYDIHGNIIPAVAQSWETTDQKRWIFHLRPDAKWSDGSTITANDFVFSWQNLLQHKLPLAQYLGFIAIENAEKILSNQLPITALAVTAIDDHTLQIQLDKANAYLPSMLAHIALMPKKDNLYNGAYRLEQLDQEKIILVANTYYWNKAHVSFQQVEYWRNNLSSPQIDLQLAAKKSANTQYAPKLCSYYYELNPNHPTLQNVTVRQALISLISSQAAVMGIDINGKATTNLLPQSMKLPSFFNFPPAEQLLMQANISNQQPLHITLTYDESVLNQQIAQNLARQFAQSDLLRVNLVAKNKQAWAEAHTQQQFQLIRSGWCADYNDPSAFLNLFHSKSPDNLLHYQNEQVDQWLEQAMVETSLEKRQQIYQQVTDTLTKDAIILPIFQYMLPLYIAPNLSGYDLNNPTQIFYSKDLFRLVK